MKRLKRTIIHKSIMVKDHPIDTPVDQMFSVKEMCLYRSIDRFFKEECSIENITKMIDIIEGKSNVSLRILDLFVTDSENFIDTFNIKIGYKSQLKTYKRQYFEPFRRRQKFISRYDSMKGKKCGYNSRAIKFF